MVVLRKRRQRAFERQLVDALEQLAGAMTAGLSLPQAFEAVAADAPVPLAQEWGLVVKEVRMGVAVDVALTTASQRIGSEDLALTAVTVGIAREVGGHLGEVLRTLAATTRERMRIEGRIAVLTSQPRLQGRVVAAMPLLMGFALHALNPALIAPLCSGDGLRIGLLLAGGVVVLELVGILWMRRITNISV